MRDYSRTHYISKADGTKIHTVKRPRVEHCEICGRVRKKINYHHWDESNYLRALWLCGRCHFIAEAIEGLSKPNSYSSRYIQLKNHLESVYV
jgi:hypothetical protein